MAGPSSVTAPPPPPPPPLLAAIAGTSKAQTSLSKIVALISTLPSPHPQLAPDPPAVIAAAGERIDLNLRLGPPPSPGSEKPDSVDDTASSGVVEVEVEVEVEVSADDASVAAVAKSAAASPAESSAAGGAAATAESECNETGVEAGEAKRDGYMGLLLEAVRRVSGEFSDCETDAGPSKRGRTATPPEASPVVAGERTRRGRNRAVPSRYKDSVLEPWAKLPTVPRRRGGGGRR